MMMTRRSTTTTRINPCRISVDRSIERSAAGPDRFSPVGRPRFGAPPTEVEGTRCKPFIHRRPLPSERVHTCAGRTRRRRTHAGRQGWCHVFEIHDAGPSSLSSLSSCARASRAAKRSLRTSIGTSSDNVTRYAVTSERVCVLRTERTSPVHTPGTIRNVPQRASAGASGLPCIPDRPVRGLLLRLRGEPHEIGERMYEEGADPGREEEEEPGLVCMPPRRAKRSEDAPHIDQSARYGRQR
jgi:hypothetical protein